MIDAKRGISVPTPLTAATIPLQTALDVRREMAKVYRDVKGGLMESQYGTRLVYILSQIGRMIELHEVEARVAALEARQQPNA